MSANTTDYVDVSMPDAPPETSEPSQMSWEASDSLAEGRDSVNELADRYSFTGKEEDFEIWNAAQATYHKVLNNNTQDPRHWRWIWELRVPRIFKAFICDAPVPYGIPDDWPTRACHRFAALEAETGLIVSNDDKVKLVYACAAACDRGSWEKTMWECFYRLLCNHRQAQENTIARKIEAIGLED